MFFHYIRNLSHRLSDRFLFECGDLFKVCSVEKKVELKNHFVFLYFSDRTGVIFGNNILSFRAIFNDVRNSIDRVHQRVRVKTCFNSIFTRRSFVFSGQIKRFGL
jgi:hypothetical protein